MLRHRKRHRCTRRSHIESFARLQRVLAARLHGVAYCRMPHGPVPVGFSVLRSALEEGEIVSVEEVTFQNGNTGEVFRVGPRGERAAALLEADDADDLAVLRFIRYTLGGLSPSAFSDCSHEEAAWKDTPPKTVIDYEHARSLSIMLPAAS